MSPSQTADALVARHGSVEAAIRSYGEPDGPGMEGKDLAALSILTRRQTPAEIGLPPTAPPGEDPELAALADALLRASVAVILLPFSVAAALAEPYSRAPGTWPGRRP